MRQSDFSCTTFVNSNRPKMPEYVILIRRLFLTEKNLMPHNTQKTNKLSGEILLRSAHQNDKKLTFRSNTNQSQTQII